MIRRISALIWLRTQMILSNGAMLFQIIFPYALLVLYDRFLNPDHDPSKSLQILFIMLPLAFSISMGTMITIMLAEEKEKKNLKTLFLSGIHSAEYLISILFYPVLLGCITIVSFPLILNVNLSNHLVEYGVVMTSVAICVILVNLLVGAVTDTQAKAQVNGVIPMMAVAFLPMFSQFNESISKVAHYTFMGNFIDFFLDKEFTLNFQSMLVPIVWIAVLIVLNFFLLKPKAQN